MTEEKKRESYIVRRINLLFFLVFILFALIILRLAVVQLVHGEDYEKLSIRNITRIISIPAPRGKILDRNGEVLVSNESQYSVVFNHIDQVDQDYDQIARDLAVYLVDNSIEVDHLDRLGMVRRIQYLYDGKQEALDAFMAEKAMMGDTELLQLAKSLQAERARQTLQERYGYGKNEKGSKPLPIKEDDLLFALEVERIKEAMNTGYKYVPHPIKTNIDKEELFVVSEHLDHLPGVDIIVEPIRKIKSDSGPLATHILGYTNSIQADMESYYLAKGYRRNQQIGVQGLEKSYEEQLRGVDGKTKVYVNKNYDTMGSEVISPPKPGNDLVLTFDWQFQDFVEKIVADTIEEFRTREKDPLIQLDQASVVILQPMTGEVLAMVNYPDYDLNLRYRSLTQEEYLKYIAGNEANIATSGRYPAGSTVKPLSVMMALQEKVVSMNEQIFDPGYLRVGDRDLKSWKRGGHGWVTGKDALKVSNNVYMYEMALRMANYPAQRYKWMDEFAVFDRYFQQFGLGDPTGIDLPNELGRLDSNNPQLGSLAYYLIGQYNSYTPLQLAQYVSTIANDGYRVQPHVVKEIREGTLDDHAPARILTTMEPKVLNRVDIDDQYIKYIQEGMLWVTSQEGGTAYHYFSDLPVQVAAKTGTAQTGVEGSDNSLIVGYAPYNKPEMAFAVVVPKGGSVSPVSSVIARRIVEAYFGIGEYGDQYRAYVKSLKDGGQQAGISQ
ncbi:peptidoglycan D,D-transpeptidase FtsI family protein [Rubeoparvulum massiliense]|uniref:peptidoglycan D,D-transpeptidase FtsI family protein n=1 Tax=Rubeoparvulum massiliense TaxID=1631346 RepID=UPI00069F4CDF|nr:penicillin-binding transpeptidase domain-containing protein [Rubeoparvulum massiliense]